MSLNPFLCPAFSYLVLYFALESQNIISMIITQLSQMKYVFFVFFLEPFDKVFTIIEIIPSINGIFFFFLYVIK